MMFSIQKTAALAFLTLVPLAAAKLSAYTRQDWANVLPGCEQSQNFWEAAECIVQNSPDECFDWNTPKDLYDCFVAEWDGYEAGEESFKNVMSQVFEAALVCLDPYHDCIVNGVDAAVKALPGCVQESAMDLAMCFITNAGECWDSCTNKEWESPFGDLNVFDLLSCDGVERNLVQPMCAVVSCCQYCVEPLEAMAECVVNDVVNFGPWSNCDFECTAPAERRQMRVQMHDEENVDEPGAMNIYETCQHLVPGLLGATQPSVELAARSNFFDCVMKEALALYGHNTTGEDSGAVEESSPDDETEGETKPDKSWWVFW